MKLQLDKETYILGKQIGTGNFATVYSTSDPQFVAKICFKSNPKAFKAFQIELDVLSSVKSEGILKLKKGGLSTLDNKQIGLLFIENCSKGSLLDFMLTMANNSPPENLVMIMIRDVARALIPLHEAGYIHRDVKMENVLLNEKGQFKLCDFGSCTKLKYAVLDNSNRDFVKEEMEENTTPFYRAPEYIEMYSGYPINESVDMFALGKPPFESGLAAVNNHYFLPENHGYSQKLIQLIISLFQVDPRKRPTAKQLLQNISQNWQLNDRYIIDNTKLSIPVPNLNKYFASVDNVYIEKTELPLGFFDQIKRYIFTLSKKTEAWVIQATENDDNPPHSQDIRSLIMKAWMKRNKIDKFYQAVQQKIVMTQVQNQRVILKLAILLHNYLKKGPPEVMQVQKNKTIPTIWTILKILNDTYKHKMTKNQKLDTILIAKYLLWLNSKLILCSNYQSIFEASYSLSPLLSQLAQGQFWQPIESKFFDEILTYWTESIEFAQSMLLITPLWRIQTVSIILMVDELYSLLSMVLHLWIAVKETLNKTDQIDANKLTEWIIQVDLRYEQNYLATKDFFVKCFNLVEFLDIKRLMPKLPDEALTQLNTTEYFKGKTKIDLNQNRSICGIKMPISYQVTVQQFQQQLLNLTQFDKKPEEKVEAQPKDFFADFGFLNQGQQQIPSDQQGIDCPWVDFSQNEQQQQISNRQSAQTVLDSQILSQIMFQVNSDRNNQEIISANFNFQKPDTDHQQQEVFSFAQNVFKKSGVLSDSKYQEVDLLNENHEYQQQQQPQQQQQQQQQIDLNQNLDLLTFDEESNHIIIPQDINFNLDSQNGIESIIDFKLENISKQESKTTSPQKQLILQPPSQDTIDGVMKFIDSQVDMNGIIVRYESIKFFEIIGQGGSCIVYRGQYLNNIIAIKEMDRKKVDETAMKEFRRETMTLIQVKKHPNLVSLIGVSYFENKVQILTEYCEGGSLFELIHRNRETDIELSQKIQFCKNIAEGMSYLHSFGYMHRDLKSLNILLDRQCCPQTQLKIADFGLARSALDKNEWMTAVVGTFHWMAPEVFQGAQYTNSADVYSFGIVMYEILSREIPYKNMSNPMQIMKGVVEFKQRPDMNFDVTPGLKQLMTQCWQDDPQKRPSFQEIVQILNKI